MKHLLAAIVASAAALTPVQAQAPAAQSLQLIDLTDDFSRIYDRDATLPDAERVARFKADFAKILPGFYDEKRFGVDAAAYDARLLAALKAYPDRRAGVERVSREFGQMLRPSQAAFEKTFGPMTGFPPVYLVNSLGEFDGGTRALPEGTRLLFGADVIDRIYKDGPVQPFVHHELFHLLHNRYFPECEPLWCSLWTEGLAVHVAARLNPGADDHALLLTSPVPLRPAVEANWPAAVCPIVAKFDSTEPEDYRPLFTGGNAPTATGMPRRYAYYVGMRVAEEIGRTRTLEQLAKMPPSEVRPLVTDALARLADCSKYRPAGERG